MTDLTMGSLFAGIGGFDIAAERVGINVLWQSENDKHASAVLAEHFPAIPNYGDIHDISSAPQVDILAGGFPCPSYSVAGQRGGLADDRGALWWEFRRLISEGQPTWVVGENVPGLLSSSGGRDFTTIIKSLVQLGYGVVWRVLDAQWFGVAQRRKRVFIVGHIGGRPRPEVLALSEGLSGYPQPSRQTGTVASALTRNGLGGGGPDDNNAQANHLIPTIVHATQEPIVAEDLAHALGANSYQAVAFAQNQRDEVRLLGPGDGAIAANPGIKQQTYAMRQREGKPGGGKGPLLSEDQSLTLASGNDQTLFTGPQVRRLTPTECCRLQGFPDDWNASQSDTQRYRQMGNAVAVPVAQWIMQRLANENQQ